MVELVKGDFEIIGNSKVDPSQSFYEALTQAEKKVSSVKATELLSRIGESLDAQQKSWGKEKLKEDLLFYLRLYRKINNEQAR